MAWIFNDSIPLYNQIVEKMQKRILLHYYSPGEKIPSVRDLAKEAGVNPNTMQRALVELEKRKLVRTEKTSGRFITEEKILINQLKVDLVDRQIQSLITNLQELKLSQEEILIAVQQALEGETHATHH